MVFIERLLLADAVHHLNDRKWAQSCHYTPQKACPVGYIGVSGLLSMASKLAISA
jgi:hypothetical protein